MLLKNKTAVVTGCNKGIGKSILELFAENGARVFACVRSIDDKFHKNVDQLKNKFHVEIIPIEFDFKNEEQLKNAAKKIIENSNSIDILVNNAGAIQTSLFQMTSLKDVKEIFEINFFAQTIFTQFIIKSMVKKKSGSVIYISSSSATDGNIGRNAYASSKAAINSQAKVLSKELGVYNIRVNVISPGLTDTDMMSKNTPKNIQENVIANTSLKRIGKPEEIANTALFLSSEMSNYITGQIIRVDGGM
jgi:3-oxoacyl-[acyl-carrier protein] reductase